MWDMDQLQNSKEASSNWERDVMRYADDRVDRGDWVVKSSVAGW